MDDALHTVPRRSKEPPAYVGDGWLVPALLIGAMIPLPIAAGVISTVERLSIGTVCLPNSNGAPNCP
jgi:hypothetical protein